MRFNIERSFTAPFASIGDTNLLNIYLIAEAITFGPALIQFVLQMVMQGFASVLPALSQDTTMMVLGVAVFVVMFILITFLNIAFWAFSYGYALETVKLELQDKVAIMPQWEGNFKKYFFNGLKFFAIIFIYFIIVFAIILIPVLLLVAVIYFFQNQNSDMMGVLSGIGGMLVGIFMIILTFALMLIFPVAIIRFVDTGKFWEAFNVTAILSEFVGKALDYILASVIIFAASIVLAPLMFLFLICTCCLGSVVMPLVAQFISPIVFFNMYAQIYKKA
jgi:hypothetical protein